MPASRHLVEAVHAGGGLFGDALDLRRRCRATASGSSLQQAAEQPEHHFELFVVGGRRVGHLARLLVLDALVHEQRRVTTVVEDHVGTRRSPGPAQRLLGAPPVLLERLALPREHRDTLRVLGRAVAADRDRGGGVVLGREDVAAHPADLGAEVDERLDEHRGLDRHVQRAHDRERRRAAGGAVLLAARHEAGHLDLGQLDLLAAPLGQGEIGDLEVGEGAAGLLLGSTRFGAVNADSFVFAEQPVRPRYDVGAGPDHRMTAHEGPTRP